MRKLSGVVCRVLVAALCAGLSLRAAAMDDPVKVEGGLLSGGPGASPEIRVYKGVPFAAPPVGPLRWKEPQPVKSWSGTRAAREFRPICPQPPDPILQFLGMKMPPMSEDCLTLNVWTPAKTAGDKLPVMVWIHGGAFLNGSGSYPLYNGENLARQGVVVVTVNYRLGPFGFFAHPLLTKESPHHSSGNYGLLDQVAALKWVKKNIPAFGGDAGRVTVFGESAGSMSVCCLMASPLAKGLFQRAIAESGSSFGANRHLRESWYGQEPVEQTGVRLAREMVGDNATDVLAALRAKSAEDILAGAHISTNLLTGGGIRYSPIVDGWALPDDPGVLFAAGKQANVPLIVGSNEDEGTIFTLLIPRITPTAVETMTRGFFGDGADAVLKLYPASNAAEARKAANRLMADGFFAAGARYFAQMQSRTNRAYLYHYSYVTPNPRFAALGAFHGSEISHVFGNQLASSSAADENGERVTKAMMGRVDALRRDRRPERPRPTRLGALRNRDRQLP